MKRILKFLPIIFSLILLAGCWDQVLFKDERLIMGVAFDLTSDEKLNTTVTIPIVQQGRTGPTSEKIQIISAEGSTPRQARMEVDRKIASSYNASKMETIVLGGDLIKKHIYPVLDVFYREPRSNLNAYLLVTEGLAEDILRLKLPSEPRISRYLSDLLNSSKKNTMIPETNLQLIFAELVDPGEDFGLPLVTVDKSGTIASLKGLALFQHDSYTGEYLTPQQTTLFLLMKDKKNKIARLSFKISEERSPNYLNYITFTVDEIEQNLKTTIKGGKPVVKIDIKLGASVNEYPRDKLNTKKEVTKLNKIMSKKLTKKANEIIAKTQEANSDVFGIGRQLIAFHPEAWDKKKWNDQYPKIDFSAKVTVEVTQQGIIN